jgi:hypothetical protein
VTRGLNVVGLKKRGWGEERIGKLGVVRANFLKGGTIEEVQVGKDVRTMMEFVNGTVRWLLCLMVLGVRESGSEFADSIERDQCISHILNTPELQRVDMSMQKPETGCWCRNDHLTCLSIGWTSTASLWPNQLASAKRVYWNHESIVYDRCELCLLAVEP